VTCTRETALAEAMAARIIKMEKQPAWKRRQEMKVKAKPLTIGDKTFESFEEFYQYVMQRQVSKAEAIKRVKQRLAEFEQKYGMTSEEFYRTIAGTPAEDEPDYLMWKMDYKAYLRLMEND
jgi:hypothetical protein